MRALANPNHHSHLQTEAILESYQKSCPNRSVHLSIGCEFGNATRSWLSSLSTSRQNLKQSDLFFNQETVVYKIEHPLFGGAALLKQRTSIFLILGSDTFKEETLRIAG
jgi:hypothetical protein